MSWDLVSISLSSSVIVSVTVKIPFSLKVKLGFCSVLEPNPSKSHSHPTISSGKDVEVSVKSTGEPLFCGSGVQVKSAVGSRSLIVIS